MQLRGARRWVIVWLPIAAPKPTTSAGRRTIVYALACSNRPRHVEAVQ